MKDSIRILFVEDVPSDAEMIWRELKKNNFVFDKMLVETKKDYTAALKSFKPELIISDFSLPQFDGMTALVLKNDLAPEIPFILVTGSINEETAVEVMKAGADDYVIKQNLSRLGSAIKQALKKHEIINSKAIIENELEQSERIFSAFLDYCPVYFFFKDNEARPIRLSKNYDQLLCRPVSEVLGKSMFDIFPHDLAKSMIDDDLKVIREKIPVKKEEEFNGLIFETTKFPIQISPDMTYIAGFTIDITEKKKYDEALNQKIEELEQFNDLTVDRELRMIELKKEVNDLLTKLGKKEKYKILE
ncbi:MAG: response regulator [Bacteroidetes bacterium]|nr:response regulator [Bacteroidota bacterium]